MQKRTKKYLFDILTAVESIEEFLQNIDTLSSYQKNKLVRRAVEREIEIIGEATNRILKLDPSIQITDAQRIVDTRNFVIHGYDNVDDIIVWNIVTNHLPQLKSDVSQLLEHK